MANAINAKKGYMKVSKDQGITWFKDCFAKSDNVDKSQDLNDVTGLCDNDMSYEYSGYTDNSISMVGYMHPDSATLRFLKLAFTQGLKVPLRQGLEEGEGALYEQGLFLMESFNISREVKGVVQVSISGKFQNVVEGYL